MGMILGAVGVILLLVAGAAIAFVIEWALVPRGSEPGPGVPLLPQGAGALPNADRWLLPAGAATALTGTALAALVIPFGPALIGQDLGIGVFYFIVVIDFVVLGVALAGWGANTPDAVEACYRIVAQLVAYVVPLGLALVGAIMMAGSLSTVRIVEAQAGLWYIVTQPLGFALFLVTGLQQAYRAPFLQPFAESIGGGILGAAHRWQLLLWRVALSGLLFLVAAMGAVLFLGGWLGPVLPGWLWMLVKTAGLMALMLWLGRRVAPLSTAQMLALSWKLLIPVGLLNVLAVGGLILLGVR